jgi:short-subunit dehydrogenase
VYQVFSSSMTASGACDSTSEVLLLNPIIRGWAMYHRHVVSELLYKDLKMRNAKLSASVLCPGWVDTQILESARNRPEKLTPAGTVEPTVQQQAWMDAVRGFLKIGFQPEEIAARVLDAIKTDTFYVLPVQPDIADLVALRLEDIRQRRNPTQASPS